MDKEMYADLRNAYRKERDPRVRARMLAAHMVCNLGKGTRETADSLMQCPDWVSVWVRRYGEGGTDALRDLPRSGRPPIVPHQRITGMVNTAGRVRITPVMLQQRLEEEAGHKFHITYVRKMMHRLGLTPKVPHTVHVNCATAPSVYGWQYRTKDEISRLKRKGFTVIALDEAFFIRDPKPGRRYWSHKGTRIGVPYTGGHQKTTVYGAVADDGRQMFRLHDRFDGPTFLQYVRELHGRFGKILVLCDRASPHRTKDLARYLRDHDGVRIRYLPRGSPYLNVVEQCWNVGKRELLVSRYYRTFAVMCHTISNYYRTARFGYDLFAYLYRSPSKYLMNL